MQSFCHYIEQFHLLFLDQLGRKIDKRLYALKGGGNLRFYFKSIRYSEDIDLDVQIIHKNTLQKHVQSILESRTLKSILQVRNIEIIDITAPKQTAITQRWKIALAVSKQRHEAHTKIEFSRREFYGATIFESVDAFIVQSYHLSPILLSHYDRASAIMQKVSALADRQITQTRDVFDLYILLSGSKKLPDLSFLPQAKKNAFTKQINMALDNISGLSYHDFLGQVVAFLLEEYRQQYANEIVWQSIITSVQQALSQSNIQQASV